MTRIVWMRVTSEHLALALCKTLNDKHEDVKARYHSTRIYTAAGPLLTMKDYVVTVSPVEGITVA